MRLKTVQVHGFKTFAHPTTFHFQDGITAIVGPNGCGKSNIADAIRWALGEQSPSNLRTKKTEDLIFTGSSTRAKMGMAQVELTLENPFSFEQALEQALEPDTLPSGNGSGSNGSDGSVAQEGGSSDILMSSVVRQSSVVQEILRARPHEVTIMRRAYRSGENEYQINRQRVRLRDVQELLQRWGLARLTYAVIGQGLIDQALSLRAEERRSLFEEAAGIGLYQTKKALALEKLEETGQNLIRVNDIINEIAPRLPSLARQADRAGKYESVATALNAHLKQWYAYNWAHAQEGFISAAEQEAAARDKLNARRALMQDLAAELTETRRTAQNLRVKLAEHRRAREQRETEFAARERELAVLQERVRFSETQHADAIRELDAANEFAQTAIAALEQFGAQPLTLSADDAPAEPVVVEQAAAPENEDALAELQARHNAEIETLTAQQRAADAAQAHQVEKLAESEQHAEADWQSQKERLLAEFDSSDQAARAQIEGQSAKLAAEREQIEHERARAIAKQRLASLRLVEFDAPALTLSPGNEPEPPPDLAAHLISLQEKLPLYESALASVAGLAAQADDLARRERALRERERLLERVRQETAEARSALALAERDVRAARQAELNARREQERAARERLKDRERMLQEREREREKFREQLHRERDKISRERERLRREHEQLVRDRERLLAERARDQERELERRRERALELQREQERERERLRREHAAERERLVRDRERAQRDLEAKGTRVQSFAAQLAEMNTARDTVRVQVEEMRAALQSLKAVAFPDEQALNESERLQNELEEREAELRSGLSVAEELYNRAVLEAERRRAEIARLEQEIEDDLGPVELDSAAPRQLRLRLVVRRPGEPSAANATPPSGDAGVPDRSDDSLLDEEPPPQELIVLPDVVSLPDGFDKEIRRLKNQMRYIGNVNPNAPQEYAELKERHAFLTEQAADLTQAIEKLGQATAELDAMMKQKFQETFDAINVQFKNYFSLLFGGGTARLELTDPGDLIHSGIEITARPPGKRAAQLVLLSGGERALTAAALIFSILKVSPTPFCVMDEVDAALDEANVGRFRDALQELSGASQFIVITHNRVTMEGARAIYGVSMGEDGVSQVLSLKLEQAAPNA